MRVIVLTGAGKHFTSGIDLMTVPKDLSSLMEKAADTDSGRAAIEFLPMVAAL